MEENKEITRLYTFIRQLCVMRYPPAFILDKAFAFAVRMHYEAYIQVLLNGGHDTEGVHETCTEWMEQSALWLKQAVQIDHRIYEQLCGGSGTAV